MLITWIVVIVGILVMVAFMTVAERKQMGSMQRRVGPNQVGYRGILQPFADGVKLQQKETILPLESSNWLFLGGPQILFTQSLQNWLVIPIDQGVAVARISNGVQFILAVSEQGVYGVIYSGWSANSKYPQIGSQRSTAQMISYSVSLSLIILTVIITVGSVSLLEIYSSQTALWLFFPQFPMVILFFQSQLAETNRAPMDLPEAQQTVHLHGIWPLQRPLDTGMPLLLGESVGTLWVPQRLHVVGAQKGFMGQSSKTPRMAATGRRLFRLESELVAGFMTEHSAVGFVYFFLGEYTNIITISTLMVIFFFGGQNIFFSTLQIVAVLFGVIWVRTALPRIRLDHLFKQGWSNILPFTIAYILFIPPLMFSMDLLGLFRLPVCETRPLCLALRRVFISEQAGLLVALSEKASVRCGLLTERRF